MLNFSCKFPRLVKNHGLLKLKLDRAGIIGREHFRGVYEENDIFERNFVKHLSWLQNPGVLQTEKKVIKDWHELKRFMLIDNDEQNAHFIEPAGLVLVPDFYATEDPTDDNILSCFSTMIDAHTGQKTLNPDGFYNLRSELQMCGRPKVVVFVEKMKQFAKKYQMEYHVVAERKDEYRFPVVGIKYFTPQATKPKIQIDINLKIDMD